jgi:tyrosyl-tRNA synthetase
MFGKLMSISDDLMWRYTLLLTDMSEAEIGGRRAQVAAGTLHPKDAKADLAKRIVADFHGAAEAARAADAFEARFTRGEIVVSDLPEVSVVVADGSIALPKLVAEAGLAASSSEAARKVQQGGVKVDRVKVTDIKTRFDVSSGAVTLEVGRRAVRVVFTAGS